MMLFKPFINRIIRTRQSFLLSIQIRTTLIIIWIKVPISMHLEYKNLLRPAVYIYTLYSATRACIRMLLTGDWEIKKPRPTNQRYRDKTLSIAMLSPNGATSFQYFHKGYGMWPLVSHNNVDLFEVGLLLSWHTDVNVYVTLWHIIIHSFYDLFQKVRSERFIRYYIWTECNIQATVKQM